LIKGGRGDFWQGRGSGEILAAGCGYANLRIIPQKQNDHVLFEQSPKFNRKGVPRTAFDVFGKGWEEIESFPKKIPS
jgi:hypothetical protein